MRRKFERILSLVILVVCFIPTASASEFSDGWYTVTKEEACCLAANAEETRFLLYKQVQSREIELYIHDALTGESHMLYFSDAMDVETRAAVYLKSIKATDEACAAFKEKYGGTGGLLMHLGWGAAPRVLEVVGDVFLLFSPVQGYARVDARTGETLLLDASQATLTRDGRVLLTDSDNRFFVLPPDSAVASPLKIQAGCKVNAARLLEDRSVWCLQTANSEPRVRNGKPMVIAESSFVHYDVEGNVLESVAAGTFAIGYLPDQFYFCGQTGIGFAFSKRNPYTLWIFRKGDAAMQILQPEEQSPLTFHAAQRIDVVDEFGKPLKDDSFALWPIGLSADGRKLLVADGHSGNLIKLQLDTLKAEITLPDAQLRSIFESKSSRYGLVYLLDMCWNGAGLLCGRANPMGCALRIP
jgi:hypothetical protein